MFSGRRFDGNKCKVQLKMLVNRCAPPPALHTHCTSNTKSILRPRRSFNLLTQKKANLAKQQKRQVAPPPCRRPLSSHNFIAAVGSFIVSAASQVALLLRDEKEANARILVEHIIREDYTLESYEARRLATCGRTSHGPAHRTSPSRAPRTR